MSGVKKRMRVNYYSTSPGGSGSSPLFKYLLTSEPGSKPNKIRVNIVNLGPPNQTGAVPSGTNEMVTDDPEIAFLGTVARLHSHHDGLRAEFGLIEESQ